MRHTLSRRLLRAAAARLIAKEALLPAPQADPLCDHRRKTRRFVRRRRKRQIKNQRENLRALLLDSAHGLLMETTHRMRSEVIRTATRKQRHMKKVVLREIAQVEGPLWCVRRVLYPRPRCLRKCLRRRKYRSCLRDRHIQTACIHMQQAIKTYLRWAGPDFRKFKALRQKQGDKIHRLCARLRCGLFCKCFWICCCGVYCCWQALMHACRGLRPLCWKLTHCCRRHPDILERRAMCRSLCEKLEYEQELLTAHLAASYCYLASCGSRRQAPGANRQLAALTMAEAKEFLRASMRKLHKAHFSLCERPSRTSQRLVEVALGKARDNIEGAKEKVGPLPIRRPKPYDRAARERQFCLLPPGDISVTLPAAAAAINSMPLIKAPGLPLTQGPGIM
ncbi:hypothetical protein Esti_001180 [Eimeria stiedai]